LRLRRIAATGLVIGALLGMAGTFMSSASWRGLAWGIDGTALVVACALLTVHHFRRGNDLAAAGFLVFVAGETLIVSGPAITLEAGRPSFAAGVALWAASLVLVGVSNIVPRLMTAIQFAGAILFAIVAVRIFMGADVTPLSQPLPFFAYPFLAATLLGWAWVHARSDRVEKGGLCGFPSGWIVPGLKDPATFFQHVHLVLPPGALLVLEECWMADDVREFVKAATVEPQARLESGTLWPRSRMHWLNPTSETLSGLSALALNHASPEVCEHIYAVHEGRLVLIWTDAFFDPLLISSEIPAESVAAFGRAVQLQPEKWEGHL
jgi:hypothetical protein